MKWLSLAIAAKALAAQDPLHRLPSYEIAAEMLDGIVTDREVANAWDRLYESDPAQFEQLVSGFPEKGYPIVSTERHDLESVSHPKFPAHALRVTDPSELGADWVKQRSGYFDLLDDDKHFFFWMFESRNDPSKDPVVLWINGGPGCSSSTGQFFELGPSKVRENLTLESNPYAWNNNATIIFLDQPVNVGFSYSKTRVRTSTMGAVDVYAFISLFFHEFREYEGLPFHISGESYGGHYLPAIGSEILQHPDRNFNFTSVLIGNGITDLTHQADAEISMACGMGGYPAVVNQTECEKAYEGLETCLSLAQVCDDTQVPIACVIANSVCSALKSPYYATGRNPYDIRDLCYDQCYVQLTWVEEYLNQAHVKKAVGAEPLNYEGCSGSVYDDYISAGDRGFTKKEDIVALLEAGIPVLIYTGDKDFNCNWLGNQQWTNRLHWSGHKEYEQKPLHPWYIEGQVAGESKNAGPLTYLRIYDAGHMVPFNKPREALSMFNQWMSGGRTFSK